MMNVRPELFDNLKLVAETISARSDQPNSNVAIVLDESFRVLASGVDKKNELQVGDTSDYTHAEIVALVGNNNIDDAHSIFISRTPCIHCLNAIVAAGISNIYIASPILEIKGINITYV